MCKRSTRVDKAQTSVIHDKSNLGNLLIRLPEKLVGMRGFEPPTPSSRTKCATGLRYIPKRDAIIRAKQVFGKHKLAAARTG